MKKYLSFLNRLFPHGSDPRMHPARDWFVILSVAFLLLVVSALWNAWLFIELANGKTLGKAIEPMASTSPQAITNVQSIFQDRATERVHYQTDYHFVDPSKMGS